MRMNQKGNTLDHDFYVAVLNTSIKCLHNGEEIVLYRVAPLYIIYSIDSYLLCSLAIFVEREMWIRILALIRAQTIKRSLDPAG